VTFVRPECDMPNAASPGRRRFTWMMMDRGSEYDSAYMSRCENRSAASCETIPEPPIPKNITLLQELRTPATSMSAGKSSILNVSSMLCSYPLKNCFSLKKKRPLMNAFPLSGKNLGEGRVSIFKDVKRPITLSQ